MSCLDCVNCFACVCIADDGSNFTREKVNTICKIMGGFKSRHGYQTGKTIKITESIMNDIKEK